VRAQRLPFAGSCGFEFPIRLLFLGYVTDKRPPNPAGN